MKTLYGRHFATMAVVLLFSFVLLGGSFAALSYQYLLGERRAALERTADNVASITATALTQYNDRTLDTVFIQRNLSYLAAIADAGIVLTTPEGQVALALDSAGTVQSRQAGKELPAVISRATQLGGFSGMSDLGGVYDGARYVVGTPVILTTLSAGQSTTYVAGLVFLTSETSSLLAMWRDTASIFLLVAAVVLLVAVMASSVFAHRFSSPLRAIAGAAREFGLGHLDTRVDVGEREDEIGDLAEAFNTMAESIEKSEERRTEFIANVSHELKTPMTTIAGFADGILDGTVPPEQEKEYLGVISAETRRLSRLVRNMLDISRVSAEGDRNLSQSQFDICEILLRVLVSLEGKVTAKNLEVVTDLPDEAVPVWGDRDAITQVCYNLLDNAIKFSREGGRLMLEVRTKGTKAHITVGDEGETIPPEELPLIFERFHKSDRSRGLDREGVGLGLYIVKSILNTHRESISCTSEDGVTRFTFTLTRG